MITEDYVSFETAKLLKEKGFDEATNRYYNAQCNQIRTVSDTFMWHWNNEEFMKRVLMEGAIAIPTLQMAMKWLRKVHEIFIRPNTSFLCPIRYYCEIFCYGDNLKTQQDVTTENFESPEESCEEAIRYCLENLI